MTDYNYPDQTSDLDLTLWTEGHDKTGQAYAIAITLTGTGSTARAECAFNWQDIDGQSQMHRMQIGQIAGNSRDPGWTGVPQESAGWEGTITVGANTPVFLRVIHHGGTYSVTVNRTP